MILTVYCARHYWIVKLSRFVCESRVKSEGPLPYNAVVLGTSTYLSAGVV
jgi:hypothetical protein